MTVRPAGLVTSLTLTLPPPTLGLQVLQLHTCNPALAVPQMHGCVVLACECVAAPLFWIRRPPRSEGFLGEEVAG